MELPQCQSGHNGVPQCQSGTRLPWICPQAMQLNALGRLCLAEVCYTEGSGMILAWHSHHTRDPVSVGSQVIELLHVV